MQYTKEIHLAEIAGNRAWQMISAYQQPVQCQAADIANQEDDTGKGGERQT